MLNHPLASVSNGARWRQESLLADAANDQATGQTGRNIRWGLIATAFLVAFFRSRSN